MGKTLYLIKQKVPDTTTNALTNAETILNTVLDAVKDVSYNPVANLLINTPDLSATHEITLYEDSNKNTQKLLNSDIVLDMFDQQYAVFVSEYQKQTTWNGNDPSYNDGTVFHTTDVGYSPAIDDYYKSYTSIDPASAPLYDATIFITTDEVNTGLITSDSRFKVNFDTTDGSGRHQVFKAVNSETYRIDSSSGLLIEEVPFNVNAGLVEAYIVRLDDNQLAVDAQEMANTNKLTYAENGYDISYANNIDVSYGSFKFVQTSSAAGVTITQDGDAVTASDLFIVDGNGFVDLPSEITSDEITGLFSDRGNISTTYSFQITNNGGGGYSFSNSSTITDNGSITINDNNLVRNEEYMKLVTDQYDDFNSQYFTWTNGTVTASAGPYTSNITIGTGAESLAEADTDASGIITFFASDLTYNASSSEPQRSRPDNYYSNNTDTLSVDYAAMDNIDASYYFRSQYHKLETRVLLPSTNTNVLTNTFNTYEDALGSSASNRYIDAGDNLVFFKSGSNNASILPSSFTVNTTGTYDLSNANATYATIFEIGSDKSFTNQSTLLEEEQLDGNYVEVPGSIVSIIATNVDVTGATDYRFKMNPKKISNNSDDSYDFPSLSNNFALVAYDVDAQTYDAANYLTTLKSNLNLLGNDIYSIMENSADLNLNIQYKTNGTATNADSLKNYFDISYSFVVSGTTTTGTHRIEDLDKMTIYDETAVSDSSSILLSSINSYINDANYSTIMSGWKLKQYIVETTFKVRTQLYLGAYSNLYVETPLIHQVDTRYGLVTASGVAKPDYYLKYLNYDTDASRTVQLSSNHSLLPVSTVTLSVDDLKSHIGDIEYTTGDADNDIDANWDTVDGPKSVDPNFDSANTYTNNGSYEVYIDVPKTYTLNAPQYIIRMEAEPSSVSVSGYTYAYNNAIFSTNNYSWDMSGDSLSSYNGVSATSTITSTLSVTYDTAEDTNITTITVFQSGNELFNIQRSGNITQKIRVIHNPRGIAETISITSNDEYDTTSSQTFTKYGTVNGNTVAYNMDTGITFQLDERFRDTSSTKSVWFLTQDVVTLQRVIGNQNFNDLSYQTVDQSTDITLVGTHNLTYGVENGVYDEAKTVTFAYYRGNALGNSATIDITRTKSSLKYVMTLNNGSTVSTGGDYGPVWSGFSQTTTPEFTIDGFQVGDFGLQIDGIANSILAGSTSTQFNLYMSFDSYSIDENNGSAATTHNDNVTVSASAYTLFAFDGSGVNLGNNNYAGRVIDRIVATTIKAPTSYDFFKITKGAATMHIYYSPVFVGHMNDTDEFPDASWSTLGQGIVDRDGNALNASSISTDETAAGFYFNNGAIYAERMIDDAGSFTCYLVCPPPQLRVTGVVVTDENSSYHGSLGGRTTLQRYDPTAEGFDTYSYYIDVNQRSLQTTYYPFADYANGSNYMNNIALYEDSTHTSTVKSIRSYRASQSYSEPVDIKENKFSIYEYSGIFAEDSSASSPYDEVESTDYILINNTYLSTLSTAIGTVTMDDTYAYYTIGIKQNKYPLTLDNQVDLGRYSTPNLKFTIGSPFLLERGLNYYAGIVVNGQLRPSFASDWVPVETIGQYVLPLEFNVGSSTRFTLYGTNFTYNSGQMTMSLKKYSTNFGVDYSDFPRELSTVTMYAKNKSYKQITLTRPVLSTEDISGNTQAEVANTNLIAAEFANESWTNVSYTNETRFISGNLRFEFVPATSYVFDVNSLDVSANLISDGVKEILSLISVTEDEPRKILFMNLEDSNRPIDGSIFGNYLPKTMTNYSGQTYAQGKTGSSNVTYVIPMKEKVSDSENIYTVYGY